jgi:hypothetical protein
VFGVAVLCVFPKGEDKEGGARGVGGDGVGTSDGVFRSPALAYMVVIRVSDAGALIVNSDRGILVQRVEAAAG